MRFARFALVGASGFVVDTAVLYLAMHGGAGPYLGRLFSYLAAATFTWVCNRRFTFAVDLPPSVREWLAFLVANSVGGAINYAVYAGLVATQVVVARHPVLGVGAGACAGLAINFALSHRVFRASPVS